VALPRISVSTGLAKSGVPMKTTRKVIA